MGPTVMVPTSWFAALGVGVGAVVALGVGVGAVGTAAVGADPLWVVGGVGGGLFFDDLGAGVGFLRSSWRAGVQQGRSVFERTGIHVLRHNIAARRRQVAKHRRRQLQQCRASQGTAGTVAGGASV